MSSVRVALANLRIPTSPSASVRAAERAVAEAGAQGAHIVCFPECFVPGYRSPGKEAAPPDEQFLDQAWASAAAAAARAGTAVVLGTERILNGRLTITVVVIDETGSVLGFQDKVQLDPSEERVYAPGAGRRVFEAGGATFGVVICHEGWRYPETVRRAVREGAQLVFHPHFHEAEPGAFRPQEFADPRNTFHEKAMLCRAAENGCWFASVNCASEGSPTTSAIVRPDGTLLAHQPYGRDGLLIADFDLNQANGILAHRYRPFIDTSQAAR